MMTMVADRGQGLGICAGRAMDTENGWGFVVWMKTSS